MLVIIKSTPDTPEGRRGIKIAKDLDANVALIQNAVYFAQKGGLSGFSGTVYALEDDIRLRGLRDEELEKGIKKLSYDELIDLMSDEEKVIGAM